MVQVPVVALGIWLARDNAGVHDTEVEVVFVAIVPDVEPKVYVSVCVNEDDARVMVIVDADPILTEVADTVDALAMLSSVMVALAVILL
jgi:hypothetical protein